MPRWAISFTTDALESLDWDCMESKETVQRVVWAYLRRQDMSVSQLARQVGIPQATLNRMLTPDDPAYRGDPDSWLKLARYRPLGLTPREVLAALWHHAALLSARPRAAGVCGRGRPITRAQAQHAQQRPHARQQVRGVRRR